MLVFKKRIMCYNKGASITAFFTGIISSILLIMYGDQEYRFQNIVIGSIFIFVSFMQLFDYLMYIDPNCKSGWNKIAGYVGPIFNAIQPLLLFAFIWLVEPDPQLRNLALVVNGTYLVYILYLYVNYVKQGQVCSYVENGRLSWAWYKSFGSNWNKLYGFVLIFNFILLMKYKYIITAGIIALLFFAVSFLKYRNHIGEWWCFFSNSIPLLILIIQKMIPLK